MQVVQEHYMAEYGKDEDTLKDSAKRIAFGERFLGGNADYNFIFKGFEEGVCVFQSYEQITDFYVISTQDMANFKVLSL